MGSIGLFYGSTTGTTEGIAEKIASALGSKGFAVDLKAVSSASADDLGSYDKIIFGTSTWGMGDLQEDWESFIDDVKDADFSGKTVALFGTGDQESYPDTFIDGVGTIYEAVKAGGAKVVGSWSTDGYDHEGSTALEGDNFVGLAIDEDTQSDMTDDRVSQWVDALASQF